MNIQDSVSCTFCKNSPETIVHLYWDCYYTKGLWERLKNWLEDIYEIPEDYQSRFYLMRITRDNLYVPKCVYFISILTKMYIHKCKNTNTLPIAQELKKYIQNIQTIERKIATGRGRLTLLKHLDKWSPFREQSLATI